ncbi:MAG: PQQ-dependent sugar dehydrogenase [Pirellulaceae bacterium]
MTMLHPIPGSVLALLVLASVASGQTQPTVPAWVQMFDQGETNPQLKGLMTPRGVRVEIVAAAPQVASPLAMTFASDGTLYVLQSKASSDVLLALRDTDGDGSFDKTETVMNDLEQPQGLLWHEGWIYFTSGGRILRRRPHDAKMFDELTAPAADKQGPPTTLSADEQWIEQQLAIGLAEQESERPSGLTLGHDGWLYVTAPGIDNRLKSWDGSQASILRSGAIFRLRPDGSQVQEFSCGLAAPQGNIACDAVGNLFQTDAGPGGWRLVHLLELADYGWRSDLPPAAMTRPGTLPALHRAETGSSAGMLCYTGRQFPTFLQGWLIAPDPRLQVVRMGEIERAGATFRLKSEFHLLQSEDPQFRPSQAIQGPDGAIYLVDSRQAGDGAAPLAANGQQGRIYRLSWSGNEEASAIPLDPLNIQALTAAAQTPPGRGRLIAILLDELQPATERAAALAAARKVWDASVLDACLVAIGQQDPDLVRLAAEAIGERLPAEREAQQRLAEEMQQVLLGAALPAQRPLYLALGKLGTRLETVPEWIFEATSVTPAAQANRQVFDGHVRAAEMRQGAATELLLGNLEVALIDPNPDPPERERLKAFVTATAEAMRTRELANFLDKLIEDPRDFLTQLEPPLQARLLSAYQQIVVDPPIRADAAAEWLIRHATAPLEVQQAAMQTLAAVGTDKPATAVAIARLVTSGKLDRSLLPQAVRLLQPHAKQSPTGEAAKLLVEITAGK